MKRLLRFYREEEAATVVEYAVLLALIVISCLGAVALVGTRTSELWSDNEEGLKSAFTP